MTWKNRIDEDQKDFTFNNHSAPDPVCKVKITLPNGEIKPKIIYKFWKKNGENEIIEKYFVFFYSENNKIKVQKLKNEDVEKAKKEWMEKNKIEIEERKKEFLDKL